MQIPVYQVDAFTSRLFGGNPAAVCLLNAWLPDATLQAIATENNLSDTAFLIRKELGVYDLRWFTPAVEVDLCGHATLAAALVICDELEPTCRAVAFDTRSGRLTVHRAGKLFAMDFPVRKPVPCAAPPELLAGLRGAPQVVLRSRDFVAVYDSDDTVRLLEPDMLLLKQVDSLGVIATAPGKDGVDFVSRFFAPGAGIDEDPVTGSAHATLVPYWSERLGKHELHALQVSRRGGELWCALRGERVEIAGQAILYSRGTIFL